MFTLAAGFGIAFLGWWGNRANGKERTRVSTFDEDLVRQSIVFTREDVKLIALLLCAILFMLGIIADKLG